MIVFSRHIHQYLLLMNEECVQACFRPQRSITLTVIGTFRADGCLTGRQLYQSEQASTFSCKRRVNLIRVWLRTNCFFPLCFCLFGLCLFCRSSRNVSGSAGGSWSHLSLPSWWPWKWRSICPRVKSCPTTGGWCSSSRCSRGHDLHTGLPAVAVACLRDAALWEAATQHNTQGVTELCHFCQPLRQSLLKFL